MGYSDRVGKEKEVDGQLCCSLFDVVSSFQKASRSGRP
jgi:hypothetical protein